jgi:ribose-phosphate pyrophosphokinase
MAMNPIILAGSANVHLADSIAELLGVAACRTALTRFPDGELHVEIVDTVRDGDVFIVQPTGPPPDKHLMELFFLADACRRAGAARLTAIIPYFGYARQDRRASGREAVGARLTADLLAAAGIQRIVAVDLHSRALEGFFGTPLEHLSAVGLLANAVKGQLAPRAVIVAPDLGAVKLAERYVDLLRLPIAIIHKIRISGVEVKVRNVVGNVRDRTPLIVDDMITTGGTIEAAAKALIGAGCNPGITVLASHALLVDPAVERLSALALKRIVVSDSLAPSPHGALAIEVVGLAPMLAEAVSRLNVGQSLADLISKG